MRCDRRQRHVASSSSPPLGRHTACAADRIPHSCTGSCGSPAPHLSELIQRVAQRCVVAQQPAFSERHAWLAERRPRLLRCLCLHLILRCGSSGIMLSIETGFKIAVAGTAEVLDGSGSVLCDRMAGESGEHSRHHAAQYQLRKGMASQVSYGPRRASRGVRTLPKAG